MTLAELNELAGKGPIGFSARYKISCLEVEPVIRAEAYYKEDGYGGFSDWHPMDENRRLILENFEPTAVEFLGADKVMVYGGSPGGHTSYRFPLRGSMYFQRHDWTEENSRAN
jgi:hypothetical protein